MSSEYGDSCIIELPMVVEMNARSLKQMAWNICNILNELATITSSNDCWSFMFVHVGKLTNNCRKGNASKCGQIGATNNEPDICQTCDNVLLKDKRKFIWNNVKFWRGSGPSVYRDKYIRNVSQAYTNGTVHTYTRIYPRNPKTGENQQQWSFTALILYYNNYSYNSDRNYISLWSFNYINLIPPTSISRLVLNLLYL